MNIDEPVDRIMYVAQIDHENYTVVRKVLRSPEGIERAPLIFYVNSERILHYYNVQTREDAQYILDSLVLRSVLGMSEDAVEAISRRLIELFEEDERDTEEVIEQVWN